MERRNRESKLKILVRSKVSQVEREEKIKIKRGGIRGVRTGALLSYKTLFNGGNVIDLCCPHGGC